MSASTASRRGAHTAKSTATPRRRSLFVFGGVALAAIAVVAGLIALQATRAADEKIPPRVAVGDDRVLGDENAPVPVVEYADFQCPACAAYYPFVKQLGQEFKNLSIVFRHFPLSQHANAREAAQAAEAAGKQGKFWEMHNLLFDNQDIWSQSSFAAETFNTYAQTLGLDMEKFKADFNSSETKTKIEADYQSGVSEIDGTPTFFLNDKKIQNPQNYDEFRNIILQAGGSI